MPLRRYADILNETHRRLNRRRYVHPDPLWFLYDYADGGDREVVALIASSLAYGRVEQILKSVAAVLKPMGSSPCEWLIQTQPRNLRRRFAGFRHRFATDEHLCALLIGARKMIRKHGSLGACFAEAMSDDDETVLPAMTAFTRQLSSYSSDGCGHLLPDPARGSACKRLNLMLRWLVRSDEVDPGGWNSDWTAKLIVPLDTHMHKIAFALGATRRKSADMTTAKEITSAFRKVASDDPVRYDFALTRLGIRRELDLAGFLDRCRQSRTKVC